MKYFKIYSILLFVAVIFLYACNNNAKAPTPKAAKPNPVALEPAQNASGVWHYTCSKRCAGGSGSAGNCKTCGSLLVHNSIYHVNANSAPAPASYSGAPFANPPATAPATAPAQNASGVWHYSCENGCFGGSGAAGKCSTCGTTLTHNAGYH